MLTKTKTIASFMAISTLALERFSLTRIADIQHQSLDPALVNTVKVLKLLLAPDDPALVFYRALTERDMPNSYTLLASVTENGPERYKYKAHNVLAVRSYKAGNLDSFLHHNRHALTAPAHLPSRWIALKNRAIFLSEQGERQAALRLLETNISGMRRLSHVYPAEYLCWLNSLAVELAHAGRIEEARRAIRVPLSSPIAVNFPPWSDTARAIERRAAARSRIYISRPPPSDTQATVVDLTAFLARREAASVNQSDRLRMQLIQMVVDGAGTSAGQQIKTVMRILNPCIKLGALHEINGVIDKWQGLSNVRGRDESMAVERRYGA